MDRQETSPILEPREYRQHYSTPIKAKVQGAAELCEAEGLSIPCERIFNLFNVSHQAGYDILRDPSP